MLVKRTIISILLVTIAVPGLLSQNSNIEGELIDKYKASFMSELMLLSKAGCKIDPLNQWNWGYRRTYEFRKDRPPRSIDDNHTYNYNSDTIKIEKPDSFFHKIERSQEYGTTYSPIEIPVNLILSAVCDDIKIVCLFFEEGTFAYDYTEELKNISNFILDTRGYKQPNEFLIINNNVYFLISHSSGNSRIHINSLISVMQEELN